MIRHSIKFFSLLLCLVGSTSFGVINKIVVYRDKTHPERQLHCFYELPLDSVASHEQWKQLYAWLESKARQARHTRISCGYPEVIAADIFNVSDMLEIPYGCEQQLRDHIAARRADSMFPGLGTTYSIQWNLLSTCTKMGLRYHNLADEHSLLIEAVAHGVELPISASVVDKSIMNFLAPLRRLSGNEKLKAYYEQVFERFYKNNSLLLEVLKAPTTKLKDIVGLLHDADFTEITAANALSRIYTVKAICNNVVLVCDGKHSKDLHPLILNMGYEIEKQTTNPYELVDIAAFYATPPSTSSSTSTATTTSSSSSSGSSRLSSLLLPSTPSKSDSSTELRTGSGVGAKGASTEPGEVGLKSGSPMPRLSPVQVHFSMLMCPSPVFGPIRDEFLEKVIARIKVKRVACVKLESSEEPDDDFTPRVIKRLKLKGVLPEKAEAAFVAKEEDKEEVRRLVI